MARLLSVRTLVLGGLAVAAGAAALKGRKRVAGLLGPRSSAPGPYPEPSTAPEGVPASEHGAPAPPPEVANVDVAGPPANTATHIPAPEPRVHAPGGGIDEAAEEAAAAAEAANIGGPAPHYAGTELHEPSDEAHRPLMEAGEGESEGLEQAEAELADNAEPAAGDPLEGGRQIDEVIESQDEPATGEAAPGEGGRLEPHPGETSAAEKSASVWQSGPSGDDQPTVEQPRVADSGTENGDGGSEWRTWSERAQED